MNLNRIAILTAFGIGLILSSCISVDTTGNDSPDETASSSSMPVNDQLLAGEGEFCGGFAAFQCAPGLTCRFDGTYPDAGGTCVPE